MVELAKREGNSSARIHEIAAPHDSGCFRFGSEMGKVSTAGVPLEQL